MNLDQLRAAWDAVPMVGEVPIEVGAWLQPLLNACYELINRKDPTVMTPEARLNAEPLLQFFEYDHLPVDKQAVSRPFGELAVALVAILPRNPERTVALRKLLEAKDCAVRASFMKMPSQGPQGVKS